MEYVLIKTDSNEWNEMWEWLAKHPLNEGLTEPMVALNEDNGEAWQYMGSFRGHGGVTVHSFRHRSHPIDNQLKKLSVNAIGIITDNDIEKVIPVK